MTLTSEELRISWVWKRQAGQVQEKRPVSVSRRIFGLSDQERTFIERADRGFRVLFTEQGRVPFYNKVTDMEYSYFTTKPEELGKGPKALQASA